MRKYRWLLSAVLSIMFLPPVLSAQEIFPSKITAVTLYLNRALVTREAKVKVSKGLNEFYLESEAFAVDKDSLSAKVFAQGSIYSVQIKDIYLSQPPQDNIRLLKEKIDSLTGKQKKLYKKKEVIAKKQAFLNSVIDFSRIQLPRDIQTRFPSIQELRDALALLDETYTAFNEKTAAIDEDIDSLAAEISLLQRELDSLLRPEKKEKKAVSVLFQSDKNQTARVVVQYLVPRNAGWQPVYKADVPSDLQTVDLTMFSRVRQKTGEDWNDIGLTVSNAVPLRGMKIPESESRFLFFPAQNIRNKSDVLSGEKAMTALVLERTDADPSGSAGYAQSQRVESVLDLKYELPFSLDIESKDKDTLLPLFSRSLKGEFYYYAVPEKSPDTFLVCSAAADTELISGPLQISFDGRFLGTAFLRSKRPGEKFIMNLGETRDVQVKKEQIKDKVKETFFGKIDRSTVIREKEFKITLENLRKSRVKIQLFDSIPVSRTDKIEVKDVQISLKPDEQDYHDKEGVLFWDLFLDPGEKKEISIGFTVTYPKNMTVSGL